MTGELAHPSTRTTPFGGRAGEVAASIVPLVALVLFVAFGLVGGWAWSWLFFLLIPATGVAVYGLRGPLHD